MFLRTHLVFTSAFLILLWLHIRLLDTYLCVCLSVSAGFLVLQKVVWFLFLLYRNMVLGTSGQAVVTRYSQSGQGDEVYKVEINTRRPWLVRPGQYVYVTLPKLRSFGFSLLESHPFMVAWMKEDERGRTQSIVLLVRACKGFTRKLKFAEASCPAIIDGPYGAHDSEALGTYDKILLMSSGIGIASHLHTARHLLLAHNKQTARVRRLTLLWFLETEGK